MVSGVLLALLTIVGGVLAVLVIGAPWAAAISRSTSTATLARHALWWGLLLAACASVILNQFFPLASAPAGFAFLSLLIASALVGWLILRGRDLRRTPHSLTASTGAYLAALVLLLITLAIRVIGLVTNYDTGHYHLGAIRYATDFAAILGLANTFFAYGYSTFQFPLAAALTWSPLGSEGYRALNSILIVVLAVDLGLRLLGRDRSAGRYVLAAGLSVVVFTMLPLADYWVVSPTQDASALVLVVAASAYLSEALTRKSWLAPAATAVVLAVSLIVIRSTMVAYAAAVLAVVVVIAIRRRRSVSTTRLVMVVTLTAIAGVTALVAAAARDYVLSGWWQYPLSVLPFDVAWRAPEATAERLATLGAARDPSNLWQAAESWDWIGAWGARALTSWEFYAALLLALAGLLGVIITRPPRILTFAVAPSAVAIVFWFLFTPPSFRFAWGPLFTLGTIAIGWSAWQLARTRPRWRIVTTLTTTAVILVSVLVTLALRVDFSAPTENRQARGLPVDFRVAPLAEIDVNEIRLDSGITLLVPTQGDQCWRQFPLCTPQPRDSLRLRGESLQEGILP